MPISSEWYEDTVHQISLWQTYNCWRYGSLQMGHFCDMV